MKPKIYVTYPIGKEVKAYLAEHCEIRQWDGQRAVPEDILRTELQEIEGLYTSGYGINKIDEQLLSYAPHLKVVSNVSVGYNNFDVAALQKRNIIGTNTPGVLDETVADLAFGLILSTARRIVELDRFVKAGFWTNETTYADTYGKDVHGATVGIIGMGRIGEAIAKRAKFGFNMDIHYHNRSRKLAAEEKYGATYRELDELLQEADFVVLMTPLTEETFQLIGEKEFKLMKKSAVFINMSRGQTVDEQALIQALKTKEIFAAGVDVYEQEPTDPQNPLLALPNVVTVPHIGSATVKTEEEMAMCAARNLVAVLTGNNPQNPIW